MTAIKSGELKVEQPVKSRNWAHIHIPTSASCNLFQIEGCNVYRSYGINNSKGFTLTEERRLVVRRVR